MQILPTYAPISYYFVYSLPHFSTKNSTPAYDLYAGVLLRLVVFRELFPQKRVEFRKLPLQPHGKAMVIQKTMFFGFPLF